MAPVSASPTTWFIGQCSQKGPLSSHDLPPGIAFEDERALPGADKHEYALLHDQFLLSPLSPVCRTRSISPGYRSMIVARQGNNFNSGLIDLPCRALADFLRAAAIAIKCGSARSYIVVPLRENRHGRRQKSALVHREPLCPAAHPGRGGRGERPVAVSPDAGVSGGHRPLGDRLPARQAADRSGARAG